MLLEIRDLKKGFQTPEGTFQPVLDVPSFDLDEREQVALEGSSGSGKTTLLHLIAGLLVPDSGSIVCDGVQVERLSESQRDAYRARRIGYVFQQFHLLGGYTALENVLLGMSFGPGADRRQAKELLERLGLGDRLGHTPEKLSVGQRQRVAVARALANGPRLVLADEPTGNLDGQSAADALRLIREVAEERGAALLVVSHDAKVLDAFERRHDLAELNLAGERPLMRTLWLIVRKSLASHALSTVVTILSVALGVGLVMAVFNVSSQSRAAFAGGPVGFDAVLGARGSKLQLVLNTIFHLETSPGNLPWSMYETIKVDRRVELAIPYAVGDNYKGYRIVGTTEELFTKFELVEGKPLSIPAPGRPFASDKMEAVVGSVVARELGLRIGDVIHPYHGIVFDERARHDEQYVIVGVVDATNSPSDRVVWIPIEGIFRMGGHVLRGGGETYAASPEAEIPDEHKEVSAVMLKFKGGNLQTGQTLSQQINNQGKAATLAWPIGGVMLELFEKLGWVSRVLELVAYLVVVVAAGGILASLTNSMNERRREFAILRALGAKRRTVFSAIVLEAGTIALLGSVLGYVVGFAILWFAALIVRRQTGVVLDPLALHASCVWAPLGAVALGMLSGVLPASQAYSTEVARNLSAS